VKDVRMWKTMVIFGCVAFLNTGCAVIAVTSAVVGTAATIASTSVDVAVGTAKVGVQVLGAAVEAATSKPENTKK
jgi:hypothetical protein